MKRILLLLLIPLAMSLISAENGDGGVNVKITNGSIYFEDYVGLYGIILNNTNLIMNTTTFNFGDYIVCPTTINGTDNLTYKTNCYSNLNMSIIVPLKRAFLNTTNNCTALNYDVVNTETQNKLNACLDEKRILQSNYQILYSDSVNVNKTNELYVKCNADLAVCNNKPSLQPEIDALKKEKEDTKNYPIFYVIGGLAVGAGACYWFTNNKNKIRNPDGNYNRTGAA